MAFEWLSKDEVATQTFNKYDTSFSGELTDEKLQALHAEIRDGGISLAQVRASIAEVCATDTCDKDELFDLLNEMDRRYFLVRDLKWEFSMLDRERKGTITERSAKFLFQAVHDDFFLQRRWVKFLRSRVAPGSEISECRSETSERALTEISFAEIEVPLCNIPTLDWLEEEKEDEERERDEMLRKKHEKEQEKEAAKRKAEAKQKLEQETEKRRREAGKRREAEEEARNKAEEEEKKKRVRQAKDTEEQRKLEEQERLSKEKKERELEGEKKRQEEAEVKRQEQERKRKEEEEAQQKWKKEELLQKQQLEKEKEEEGIFIYTKCSIESPVHMISELVLAWNELHFRMEFLHGFKC